MDYSHHLTRLGVRLVRQPLPDGWWGVWDYRKRVIRVDCGLSPVQQRCTVFHELGHAAHGHRRSTERTELEADVWAARHLIAPECWHHVTAAYDDLLTVAAELQVLPRIAAVYAKHLSRHPAMRQVGL